MMRLRVTKQEISTLDGKGLITLAVNKGMVGKNGVMEKSIGEVKSEGDFAKAQMHVKGQKTPFYFQFHRENNQWKIDITSVFPITDLAFKKLIKESDMTENEYIF
jgi:hypothetical protein